MALQEAIAPGANDAMQTTRIAKSRARTAEGGAASVTHVPAELLRGEGGVQVGERALFADLARRGHEAGHGGLVERGGEAHPPDAGRFELGDRPGLSGDAHHEVEGPFERLAYRA